MMLLSNYTAAFAGNRQLANMNTDAIFSNRIAFLRTLSPENDVQTNFVNSQINKARLDALVHRAALNSKVIEISARMAEINAQLIDVNRAIMQANEEIVAFNGAQLAANSAMIAGEHSMAEATVSANAVVISTNAEIIADLGSTASENSAKLEEHLTKTLENRESISTK